MAKQRCMLDYFQPLVYKVMPTTIDKNTITVHFTNYLSLYKKFHKITIHTPTKEDMITFLERLGVLLESQELHIKCNDSIQAVKCSTLRRPHTDYNETCDWGEMPEFNCDENFLTHPFFVLNIEKGDKAEAFYKSLAAEFDMTFTSTSKYKWFPERPIPPSRHNYWSTVETINPKYSIYIISKGRWETRQTSRYLEWASIPYFIVIEPSEYAEYAAVISPDKIITMPVEFKDEQLALGNGGGIPVRNFVMRHSKAKGEAKHWILDDNILSYKRLNNNDRVIVKSGVAFRMVEDYVDRYDNIMLSGHNYSMFGVSTNTKMRPITRNSRIYSSILIDNRIPFEWRGRYNEDTDLSLRVMKAGYPTVLFNNILADKVATLTTKGGNTDSIYAVDNFSRLKSQSLADQHPDVATVIEKFGRTHHWVDYSPFKHLKKELKAGIEITNHFNNYGMILCDKTSVGFFR